MGAYRKGLVAAVLLSALIVIVYWPVQSFDFINYDDPSYIMDNPHVKAGLTKAGFIWAFKDIHTGYWHPLTWFSHMLDCEVFGTKPGGHHWTSLIFHLLNTLLLFRLLVVSTGERDKSFFVSALFALHPLNVESVVWVAERKNVLSTFLWLTTMSFYVHYARDGSRTNYTAALLSYAAGLLAKPMLVTLPFVLLLMDFWPLRRWDRDEHRSSLRVLIIEKVPFFALAAAVSAVTIWASQDREVTVSLSTLPLLTRLGHALISYVVYLWKFFWPIHLAVFYPHPLTAPLWQAVAGGVLISVMTVAAISWRLRRPYLLMGWLWYLGTLVPVIGVIQVGWQAMADRYAYVPFVGLFICVAWGVPELVAPLRRGRQLLLAGAIISLVYFGSVTSFQIQFWRDSTTLFSRALETTRGNWVALNNLGAALLAKGRVQEAMTYFREVLRLKPDYPYAHNNMALALAHGGRFEEARGFYLEALRYRMNYVEAHNNLALALAHLGRYEEAMDHLDEALRRRPYYPEAWNNKGYLYALQGRHGEAIPCFERALAFRGDYPDALNNLGASLAKEGRVAEATERFQQVLSIAPDDVTALNNLGIALFNLGRYQEARRQFEEVLKIDPGHGEAKRNLAHIQAVTKR